MLSKVLFEECVKEGIEFKTSTAVTDANSTKDFVDVLLSTG